MLTPKQEKLLDSILKHPEFFCHDSNNVTSDLAIIIVHLDKELEIAQTYVDEIKYCY